MKELHSFTWDGQQIDVEIDPMFSSDSKYKFLMKLIEQEPDLVREIGLAKQQDPDLVIDVKVTYPDNKNYDLK